MKRFISLTIALVLAGAVGAQASADLDQALDALAKYEFGQGRLALETVLNAVHAANSDAALKQKLETRFDEMLAGAAPIDAKRFIGRQLAVMGTAASVPALTGLLGNAETADFALRALEGIPAPEAAAALRDALKTLPDAMKLGPITELARRGDKDAVPGLIELMGAQDKAVANAAIYALGSIGGEAACQAPHGAFASAAPELKAAVADACLSCAAGLGDVAWLQELAAAGQPGHIRAAALSGLIQAQPKDALAQIVAALGDPDRELVHVAAGYVRDQRVLPGAGATKAIADMLAKATPENQIMLIDALADRNDSAAGAAVRAAADSSDEAVRLAALKALGRLGDARCTEMLLKLSVEGSGDLKRTARTSLSTLPGRDVNPELLRIAKRGKDELRVEAVRALTDRRAVEMKGELLGLAKNEVVRSEVFKAMQAMADESDLPPLFAALEQAKDDAGRQPVENAITAVCERIVKEEVRADAVLAKLAATQAPELRLSLIRILGGVPNAKSLETLRAALQDADAQVRLAALNKLGAWPNAAPLDDLKAAAAAPKSDEERAEAVKGYIRLLRAVSDRPVAELVARYAEVLGMLKNAGEKKAALSGLAGVPASKALELAQQLQADPEVAGEAGNAALKIAQSIAGAYPDKAKAVAEPFLAEGTPEPLKKVADAIVKAVAGFEDYITAFEVSGPYAEEGKNAAKLFETAFPPEKGEGQWRIMAVGTGAEQNTAFVADLQLIADNARECVAYLRTTVTSPAAQEALLEVGSNDGVKVWLNGEVVDSVNVGRPLVPGQDKIKVQLKEGANALLIAVYQQGGQWGACARFRAPDGNPLPGVKAAIAE